MSYCGVWLDYAFYVVYVFAVSLLFVRTVSLSYAFSGMRWPLADAIS